MNKCLTVLVNLLIWDQHAKPEGILCLSLCLLGGAMYDQAPMRKEGIKGHDDVVVVEAEKEVEAGEMDSLVHSSRKDVNAT
jgi:GDP-mannose transporter